MRKQSRALTVATALASVLMLPAQASQTPDLIGDLTKAAALWSTRKPNAYEFTLQPICGLCPAYPPGAEPHFRVQQGVGTLVNGGRTDLAGYATVEAQFAFIRRQMERRLVKIDVTYDPQRGYPTRAYFDPTISTDDEFGFQVSAFKVLSEDRHSLPNIALQLTSGGLVVARLRARHLLDGPLAAERER